MHPLFLLFLWSKLQMARGKGKNWPKLKILAVLKSAHQKFSENALSKLKNSFCEFTIWNRTPYWWFLNMPTTAKIFCVFGPRWHWHHFCSRLEFWAKISFGQSSNEKNGSRDVRFHFIAKKWLKTAKRTQYESHSFSLKDL